MVTQRLWWQEVDPAAWRAFGLPEDLVRERYTALLAALEELSTRAPMSTLPDIADHLRAVGYHDPLPELELRDALDRLTEWTLLEPFRDWAATMSSLSAVRHRQEAWALTRTGRAVVAAVRDAVVDARRSLQLPARLLDSVERTLRQLLQHEQTDRGLLPSDLDDARTRIQELQRVTADFYAALAQLIQADVTDDEIFGDNRDRVLEALRQFPREYERAMRRVRAALTELDAVGHHHIASAAVGHAGLIDSGDARDWVDERVRRLDDLAAWFTDHGTIAQLIRNASGAAHTLLVAIDRRYTARRRGSDLGSDFHQIAQSMYAQPDDDSARAVWAAAFGDWPALHPAVGGDGEDISHGQPAANGRTRFQVEVTLREHERVGPRGGRPHKVPDAAQERAAALAAAQDELLRRRRNTEILVTDGEVSLDHYAGLESDAAAILLRAIEVAWSAYDPVLGYGEAQAEGATAVVRVHPGAPGARVRVRLAEGVLEGPDIRISVRDATAPVGSRAATAAPRSTPAQKSAEPVPSSLSDLNGAIAAGPRGGGLEVLTAGVPGNRAARRRAAREARRAERRRGDVA